MAGSPGFGLRSGEVWGVHVAWSGNHEHLVERLPEGAGMHGGVIGGGELLRPGEVRLAPGATYTAAVTPFALVRRRAWTACPGTCTGTCGPGRAPAPAPRRWS